MNNNRIQEAYCFCPACKDYFTIMGRIEIINGQKTFQPVTPDASLSVKPGRHKCGSKFTVLDVYPVVSEKTSATLF